MVEIKSKKRADAQSLNETLHWFRYKTADSISHGLFPFGSRHNLEFLH